MTAVKPSLESASAASTSFVGESAVCFLGEVPGEGLDRPLTFVTPEISIVTAISLGSFLRRVFIACIETPRSASSSPRSL